VQQVHTSSTNEQEDFTWLEQHLLHMVLGYAMLPSIHVEHMG
jgi:hypothetical protein